MIAAFHTTAASSLNGNAANDESTNDRWPVKVVDRIAMFEQRILDSRLSSCKREQSYKALVDVDADTVRSFLDSIGQEPPETLSPRLWRYASQWNKQIHNREQERKGDVSFFHISNELDRLDAILYSDCTSLEMEAIALVASSTRSNRQELASYEIDYCEDSDDEFTVSDDDSIESEVLVTLETGLQDLAKELKNFD